MRFLNFLFKRNKNTNIDYSYMSKSEFENKEFLNHHKIFLENPKLDKDIIYNGRVRKKNLIVNEDYFEWIDVLMSIKDCENDNYHFCELGSGYGAWGVRAFNNLYLNKKIKNYFIDFVEAEPRHVQLNFNHCRDNNIENFNIWNGIVSNFNGEDLFYVNQPNQDIQSIHLDWWGQAKVQEHEVITHSSGMYEGNKIYNLKSGYQAIKVKTINIKKITKSWTLVDCVNIDVQGEEYNILNYDIKNFNNKVKRLHIGTHGHEIEKSIFKLLSSNGWINIRNYPMHTLNDTPYGKVQFVDGSQSWINSRFNATFA